MWIVSENESYEIVGYNIREFEDGSAELWITKSTGKTAKILTGTIEEVKKEKMSLEYEMLKGSKTYDI